MNEALVKAVGELYAWLDREIEAAVDPGRECRCRGDCCDFETFDHRLYVTTPELLYFQAQQGDLPLRPMTTGRCPYNEAGRCTVYATRFAGCRIFGCQRSEALHSRLSEAALLKFKSLCEAHNIPYRYVDLATALGPTV